MKRARREHNSNAYERCHRPFQRKEFASSKMKKSYRERYYVTESYYYSHAKLRKPWDVFLRKKPKELGIRTLGCGSFLHVHKVRMMYRILTVPCKGAFLGTEKEQLNTNDASKKRLIERRHPMQNETKGSQKTYSKVTYQAWLYQRLLWNFKMWLWYTSYVQSCGKNRQRSAGRIYDRKIGTKSTKRCNKLAVL